MSDRRTKKTKTQLRAALMKLLKEKSIKEITIKELVNEVDINRSTFYLHYKDIYDMLNQIENELLDELLDVTDKYKTEQKKSLNYLYLVDTFKVLEKNIDIVSVLLGPNGDFSFLKEIIHMISDKIIESIKSAITDKAISEIDYTFSFYLTGCIGLVYHWIENGVKDSPEYVANLCFTLITEGIKNNIKQVP